MICLRQVSYSYPHLEGDRIPILNDIDLVIPPGRFTAIIGPNNSGKSTLAKILAGLLIASSGQVLVDGTDISNWNLISLRKTIGLVFSNPEDQLIFPTVEEDLSFGLENFHFSTNQIKGKITNILEFIGMKEYRYFPIHKLSGGQKQKIAIASILVLGLRYIVFDEPTYFLDLSGREDVLTLLQQIHNQGTTIIYIASLFEELAMADTIVAIVDGKIKWQGDLTEALESQLDLADWGIEIPSVVHLVNKLKLAGIKLFHPIYTVNDLVAALKKLKYGN